MKKVNLTEEETKYIVNIASNKEIWNREFIIYQWYNIQDNNYESKYKLILDFLNLSLKFVKVEKRRIDAISSDKTVTYLDVNDCNFTDFIGLPFIMKRRSIKSDAHLDKFIYSNNRCSYLLELENQESINLVQNDLKIIEDVSENLDYRNINMAVQFTEEHLGQLKFLIELFK